MIASIPEDRTDKQRLRVELRKIHEECPTFMTWLRDSYESTIEAVVGNDGAVQMKQTGAMGDLREILKYIDNPPELEDVLADGQDDGQGFVY